MPPSPAAPDRRLSRERAVSVALDIVRREGVEALSMRRLGRELGVDPMAVYHHVPGKQALFDELVAAVWGRLEPPAATGDWEQRLRGLAAAVRELLTHHANALPIIATRSSLGAGTLAALEHGVGALREAGLDAREALATLSVATSWLIGHALAEAGTPPGGVPDASEEEVLRAYTGGGAAYPHLAAAVAGGLPDWDEVFEQGLEVLVHGVRARAAG